MDPLTKLCRQGLPEGQTTPFKDFTLKPTIIQHEDFNEVVRRIADVHRRGKAGLGSSGFLLTAQSGTGKSRLLEYYRDHFPDYIENGCTRIPVLYVEAPEAATTSSLSSEILEAMGEPFAHKGTKSYRKGRVRKLISACKVELVVIDDFQHFYEGNNRNERVDVSTWLKLLLNETKVPVVLSGLPRSIHVLKANRELRRRFFTAHYYPPFSIENEEQFNVFRSVLKELQQQLPVGSINLYDRNFARRMYFATNGLLDYVIKILTVAVTQLRSDSPHFLGLENFELAFEEVVSRTLPRSLNPFFEEAELRSLTRPSEPFDQWENPVELGLLKKAGLIGDGHAKRA